MPSTSTMSTHHRAIVRQLSRATILVRGSKALSCPGTGKFRHQHSCRTPAALNHFGFLLARDQPAAESRNRQHHLIAVLGVFLFIDDPNVRNQKNGSGHWQRLRPL